MTFSLDNRAPILPV